MLDRSENQKNEKKMQQIMLSIPKSERSKTATIDKRNAQQDIGTMSLLRESRYSANFI